MSTSVLHHLEGLGMPHFGRATSQGPGAGGARKPARPVPEVDLGTEVGRLTAILQSTLLPPELPTIDGLDVALRYLPTAGVIGGDFYDVFPLPGGSWGLALGDVCGKGASAAATAAVARYSLRTASTLLDRPSDTVRSVNQSLVSESEASGERFRFTTMAYVVVRPSGEGATVTASMAGHPPLLILRTDGEIERVEPTGPVLGVMPEAEHGERSFALGPGDVCLMYTDGATDIRYGGETFGEEHLVDVVRGCRGLGVEATVESIERSVMSFQGEVAHDDLAVLAFGVPLQP